MLCDKCPTGTVEHDCCECNASVCAGCSYNCMDCGERVCCDCVVMEYATGFAGNDQARCPDCANTHDEDDES